MDPHMLFDLRNRFQNLHTEYEKKPYQLHVMPITDKEVDELEHERPYWVAPDLSGEHGNYFNLVALSSAHISSLGFKEESAELRDIALNNIKKNDMTIYNVINQFLDYHNAISLKVIDGEEYVKISKNTEGHKQLPEFQNVNLQSVIDLQKNNFDFNSTNIYGRNILFYVKDRPTMEWLFENIYDINNHQDYIKLFELDAFNSSLLIKHQDPDMIDFILGNMLTKEKEFGNLIQKWCVGVDRFSRCMEDSIVKNLNVIFDKDKAYAPYMKEVQKIAGTLAKIRKVYPEFTNSIINRGNIVFKNDEKKLKFWKQHMEYTLVSNTLKDKEDTTTIESVKSLKI